MPSGWRQPCGELTPLEVVDAAIAAITAVNPALNAVVVADFERARANARSVPRNLPLRGVPFLIKVVALEKLARYARRPRCAVSAPDVDDGTAVAVLP